MKVRWSTIFWPLGSVFLCLVSGVVGSALTTRFAESTYTVSYADFISIMLTAISLLMTLLAFFIAIVAVIGWNALNRGVQTKVEELVEHGFREGNPLYKVVEQTAERAATRSGYRGIGRLDQEREEQLIRADEDKEGE